MDDLFGAVFKANLKIAVVGKASRSWSMKKDIFEVDKLGVYVRDTYDFDAPWYEDITAGLGVWTKDRLLSKQEIVTFLALPIALRGLQFPGAVPLRNWDFRESQTRCDSGGDFFVFSDVLWLPPKVDHVVL